MTSDIVTSWIAPLDMTFDDPRSKCTLIQVSTHKEERNIARQPETGHLLAPVCALGSILAHSWE